MISTLSIHLLLLLKYKNIPISYYGHAVHLNATFILASTQENLSSGDLRTTKVLYSLNLDLLRVKFRFSS